MGCDQTQTTSSKRGMPDSVPSTLIKKTKTSAFSGHNTPSVVSTSKLTSTYHVPCSKFDSEDDVIKHRGFKLKNKLGAGGFGTVYRAVHVKTDFEAACKKMMIGDCKHLLRDMKYELFVLEKVDHPFLVRLYQHFIINDNIFIFMQLANGGSFSGFVHKNGPFSEKECKVPFAQILSGIAYMHKLNIAHRDMKLANVLLLKNDNSEYNILITDFGLSRIAFSKKGMVFNKTYCGTPPYMAPEISGHQRYNAFLVDVWALGVMLFVMISLDYPFDVSNRKTALKNQLERNWKFKSEITHSKELESIMQGMLEPNPRKRISVRKLIKHKWIAGEYARLPIHKSNNSNKSK